MPERIEARREADRRRQKSHPWRAWYATKAWKQRRARQLKEWPLCEACLAIGASRPATVADHDPPHRGDRWKFFHGPLKSLCDPHHDAAKQREEKRGFSEAVDDDGWPTDPSHPFNLRSSPKK